MYVCIDVCISSLKDMHIVCGRVCMQACMYVCMYVRNFSTTVVYTSSTEMTACMSLDTYLKVSWSISSSIVLDVVRDCRYSSEPRIKRTLKDLSCCLRVYHVSGRATCRQLESSDTI